MQHAVDSSSGSLQFDALRLACVYPSSLESLEVDAGDVELRLVKQALVLGLRCTSSSMRNKWNGLLPKLLRRVLMSVHTCLNRQRAATLKTGRGPHVDADQHADLAGTALS